MFINSVTWPEISGISLSRGDRFQKANREELIEFFEKLR